MSKSIIFRSRRILSSGRELYTRHGCAASYLSTFSTNRVLRPFHQEDFPVINSSGYCSSNRNRFSFVVYNEYLRNNNASLRAISHSSVCQVNENELKEEQSNSKVESGQSSTSGSPDKPLTQRQKLARTFAAYGTTGVVFHTCISLASLGTCYMIVSSGIDMVSLLEKIGIASKAGMQSTLAGGASTFVIAYACHKVFMPVRIFLTVTCTPIIVNRLKGLGLLKDKAKAKAPGS